MLSGSPAVMTIMCRRARRAIGVGIRPRARRHVIEKLSLACATTFFTPAWPRLCSQRALSSLMCADTPLLKTALATSQNQS
jgi:hypothetical protein